MTEFKTKADLIEAHAQFMFNTYGGSIETERKVSEKEPVFVHKSYAITRRSYGFSTTNRRNGAKTGGLHHPDFCFTISLMSLARHD